MWSHAIASHLLVVSHHWCGEATLPPNALHADNRHIPPTSVGNSFPTPHSWGYPVFCPSQHYSEKLTYSYLNQDPERSTRQHSGDVTKKGDTHRCPSLLRRGKENELETPPFLTVYSTRGS